MRRPERLLVFIVFALISLGLVVLASASGVKGEVTGGDPAYYIKRQLVWLLLAVSCGWGVSRIDYRRWNVLSPWLMLVAVVALGLVLVPGVGSRVGGSSRWLRFGPVSFQASEFAKLAVIMFLASWVVRAARRTEQLWEGFALPMVAVGLVAGLVFIEPDYGTTVLIGAVSMCMLFAGGSRPGHLVVAAFAGACALAVAVMSNENRARRIGAFLDPQAHPDAAFQLIESQNAFILGGLRGVGPGHSAQKHYFLPEAHTDFILAIIGEEMGLCTVLIVLAFAGLLGCGLWIAFRAPDAFGRYLAFGLTVALVLQGAINIGVVTGALPTKGIALPFISYGGTSLVMTLLSVGVLHRIGREGLEPGEMATWLPATDR